MKQYNTTLTIAGSDPSGGAGIQADIKAISACGGYAQAVITSLTSQNTLGVQGVFVVPAEVVYSQAESVMDDMGCKALKIGMLPSVEIIDAVVRLIEKYDIQNVVLDPVMVSTSGAKLIDQNAVKAIITKLLPLADVVTPNIPEAALLSGMPINSEADFGASAQKLIAMGAKAVLLKAGHLDENQLTDHLYYNNTLKKFTNTRIYTPNTHGTGCTLSSSLAAFLSAGKPLDEAVGAAISYLNGAIKSGAEYYAGRGHGAVDHFYKVRR